MSVYDSNAFSYLPRPYWLYTVVITDDLGMIETWTQYAWSEAAAPDRDPEEAHASVRGADNQLLMSKQRIT